MLEVRDLNVHFGVIHAIKGISFSVDHGEIVTLIGANGAGKTTTLRSISGLKKPTSGSILLEGTDITSTSPQKRVALGLSQVPEGRRVFPEMTVLENLELGAFQRKDVVDADFERVYHSFPVLAERRRQLAGTLSGGEQQMLAMGRALMANPKMMLLDEPSMGLAPLLVAEIFDIIVKINQTGTTVLLVEQNANVALQIAHRAYVLETGQIVLSGDAKALAATDEVKRAYLGG